jgi:hypothetical protein
MARLIHAALSLNVIPHKAPTGSMPELTAVIIRIVLKWTLLLPV